MRSLNARVARLEHLLRARRHAPRGLDLVDLLTLMELATGVAADADVGDLWHRVRGEMGIEDDGSGGGPDLHRRQSTIA